jgi:anti-anti-sigma factor
MDQFTVESSMSELGTVMLSVRGELEITTADTLVDELCQWLGIRECVVDLSGCDFVDSVGIRALIECRHQIGPDATMRLVGLSPHVERTLRRVGFDQMVTFQPASMDAASSPETNGTADSTRTARPGCHPNG